jgi:hypothetical protein
MAGGIMSVEIFEEDTICVNENFTFELTHEEGFITINFYEPKDKKNWTCLDKIELAQLIAALQAMHDKMGE